MAKWLKAKQAPSESHDAIALENSNECFLNNAVLLGI